MHHEHSAANALDPLQPNLEIRRSVQHTYEDFPERDDKKWMKHTAAWFDGWGGKGGSVKIDCRPVHEYTLTDDAEFIKPKKRVY